MTRTFLPCPALVWDTSIIQPPEQKLPARAVMFTIFELFFPDEVPTRMTVFSHVNDLFVIKRGQILVAEQE